MGSLAGFAHRLLVEFDGTSKWEVQETGKAPEPPNSKVKGLGTSHFLSFRPPVTAASFPPTSPPAPKPAFRKAADVRS